MSELEHKEVCGGLTSMEDFEDFLEMNRFMDETKEHVGDRVLVISMDQNNDKSFSSHNMSREEAVYLLEFMKLMILTGRVMGDEDAEYDEETGAEHGS